MTLNPEIDNSIFAITKESVKRIDCNDIVNKYRDVFQGIGQLSNFEYKLELKEDSKGQSVPCRKVPFKLMDQYKNELDTMEKEGIIRKVNEPTDFENAVVILRKPNNSLRICLDPQYLNSCLKREHFKLPTFEEISSKMNNAKIFSVLDANKAFYQIKLNDESAKLTTFQTPYGRYCFSRMPYGINSAPEIFHKQFTAAFEDIPNVQNYIDDIIIWSNNEKEHKETLGKVLQRARERNITLNGEKCKIGVSRVKFLGHVFTDKGIEIDSSKVNAISNMNRPECVEEMERFLGMVNYVSKFIEMANSLTAPLREMTKKNGTFAWTEERVRAYENLKKTLISSPTLQYYDPNKECKLSVDESSTGVGAVLLQNNLPVAYASRAFTQTQKSWAQIEKELYAIVFGCERFHQYIFGHEVKVESNHKPLTPILKKPLANSPVRLQKMRLRLQPYDINVEYKPGKEMYIADALSRLKMDNTKVKDDDDLNSSILVIDFTDHMSEKRLNEFRNETKNEKKTTIGVDTLEGRMAK